MNINFPQNFWKIPATVATFVVIFLAVISIKEIKEIAYVGKNDQIINTITVNGKGERFQKPDIATFSFSVTENAVTVADAQTKATTKTNNALKGVTTAGVADKDVKTLSYNINPRYEYQEGVCTTTICRPGKSVLIGYEVSQTIQVKVRDLSKAGEIFGSIGATGVQNVNSLSFSIDDADAVKDAARSEAIVDAQTKAQILAHQLGVTLVRVNSFYDSSDSNPPAMYAMADSNMMSAKVQSAPTLPAGENKVSSNVSITYEIK